MRLLADLVDPFPGRAARALEISFVCMLVVMISMTYRIPDPATSAYLVFFAAKEDSGASIIANIALVVVVTIVVAFAFGLALLSLNSPEARILILAAWTFVTFFLATASRLAPLAGTLGLIIAYAIDLFANAPLGDIATRGLLYAWLFVAMPMATFFAYNVLFGRRPDVLLGNELARQVRSMVEFLENPTASSQRNSVAENCRSGLEPFELIKTTSLFHFAPPARVKRLRALVVMAYNLSTAALATIDTEPDVPRELVSRLDDLADAIEGMGDETPVSGHIEPTSAINSAAGSWGPIETLISQMKDVVVNGVVPDFKNPHPGKHGTGFFLPDAYQNPDHTRYALKGTLAVMICYLTFALLDWPAIHTCMLTCFIVGLTTAGESIEKLLLRISGCLIGAALGLCIIVFVLPHTQSIWELMALIGLVTLPAAWVAVGRPSVSYIGFQAAFALYLCILQGDAPKFDLTIIRDRTIGILFGNLVVYFIFTNVYPVSVLPRLRDELVQLLERSREVLRRIAQTAIPLEAGYHAAALQTALRSIERSAAALSYESLNSPVGARPRDTIDRCFGALRDVIDIICRLAVCSSLDLTQAKADIEARRLQADSRLAALAATLADAEGKDFEIGHDELIVDQSPAEPTSDGVSRLHENITRLARALSDYRNLLRVKPNSYA